MVARRSERHARESAAPYTASILSERDLKDITRRIVRAAHPDMIILFGSRVYGEPRPDSDLDLLVVMDEQGSHAERIAPFRNLFPQLAVPLDIQARTRDEVTQRLEMGDEFMQRVVGRGQKLYPLRAKNGFVRDIYASLERGRTQPMNNTPLVHEWVEKAEGDYVTAQVLARQKKKFSADNLCWACQQCVEKYLKAFLTRHRVEFERIHKLDELHALCMSADPDFRLIKSELDKADICQPKIRYPGSSVTAEQAREAFAAAKPIRKFIRAKLGLR
jgi:HEPN domain-containing protein/predicted nucleotidyltransferase